MTRFAILLALLAPAAVSAQTVSVGFGFQMYDVISDAPVTWANVAPSFHKQHPHKHDHDGPVVINTTVHEYVVRDQSGGAVVEAVLSESFGRLSPNLLVSWELGRDRPHVLPQISVVVASSGPVAWYLEGGATVWESDLDEIEPHVGTSYAASLSSEVSLVAGLRAEPWADWRPTMTMKANVRVW